MLEAKCLKKAVIPSTLINNPSPGTIQSTRLALHVTRNRFYCFLYIASGPHIYKLQEVLLVVDKSLNKNYGELGLMVMAWDTGACSSQGLRFESPSVTFCIGSVHIERSSGFKWAPTSGRWDWCFSD
ncbi:hypothetical protein TSUD_288770 [Trifolium subterraneum]|uniref:Uncharacterized protein n=1 Tax=Trifolium subterraneum TaxID=3900 RepID=A0A2Z6MHA3_TRISU|nr:hypothetical protein TSUD_288770 [Trifolium subterraneum]